MTEIRNHVFQSYPSLPVSLFPFFVFPYCIPYLLSMITVAVGIIMKQAPDFKQVLLCQRKKSIRYGLKWEFPGGKVENGERTEDCLIRELHEELYIRATIGSLYHQQHYVYPDSGTFDVFYYLVPTFTGTIVNRVFESYKWVPVATLLEYDILEGNRDVTAKLMDDHG